MSAWQMSTWAKLRGAGFPFALLGALRSTAFAQRMRAAAAAPDTSAQDWARLRAEFDGVLAEAVEQLCRTCRDDRFLEAMYLSSPGAYTFLRPWLQRGKPATDLDKKDRRRVHTLMMYLQRLCAKNETASFFGPASWVPVGDGSRPFEFSAPATMVNRVFWSHWAVQRIADVVSNDPHALTALTPRRTPWTFDSADGAHRIDFLEHPAEVTELPQLRTAKLRRVLELCDGERSVAGIARILGVDAADPSQLDDLHIALKELDACGAIELGITIPSGTAYPMDHLRAGIERLPEQPRARWTAVADDLDAGRATFERGSGLDSRVAAMEDLNDRFRRVGGGSTSRGHGELARDRAIVFEDCRQDWRRAALAGPAVTSLREDFPVVLDLMFELPLARLRARRAEGHRWFVERFGAGADVGLDRIVTTAVSSDLSQRLRAVDDDVREKETFVLCDALYADPHSRTVDLPMAWAREQVAGRTFDAWALCSADLHLAASDVGRVAAGDFTWVLGEIHALHEVMLGGALAALHPAPREFAAQCAEQHAALGDAVICEPVRPHRGKTSIRTNIGTPEIEFAARSVQTGRLRLSANELRIRDAGDRLALRSPRHGEVELMIPPERWLEDEPGSIFGCFTGVRAFQMTDFIRERRVDHLPRLRIGRFIVFRETWWLDPVPAGKWQNLSFEGQRLAWAVKEAHHLPNEVFVKFDEEPKPIYVDFHNPILVDLFARGLTGSRQRLRVTELLPASDELWLDHGDGAATSEFRIGFYRPRHAGTVSR